MGETFNPNWTFARNRGQGDALKSFFVFGFVKLKCCSLQFCSFLGDGNIFEKEEPIEKLVPYGSNNNNNKDNNILGCVQCLM